MEIIIFIVIILASLAYITQPYFQKQPAVPKTKKAQSKRRIDLQAQRDTVLASIKDLEFDREMGKVSEEDYLQMNDQFRREAVSILQQIDQSNGRPGAHKKRKRDRHIVRQQKNAKGGHSCMHCGAEIDQQDRFCSNCGGKAGKR
ncbi:MAG: zinc ribbon domain-containing protein [bacterium]